MTAKITIFDLDGTLTLSKQPMTAEMGAALKKLLDKMPVAVMSGADFPQFQKQFLPYLPPDTNLNKLFLFPTSAAQCLEYKSGRWHSAYDNLFTENEKKKIIDALSTVPHRLGVVKEAQTFGPQIEDRGEQVTWSALGQNAPLEAKKVWDPDHAKRGVIQSELKILLPEFEVKIGGNTSIDINRKGISKKDGILWLQNRLGIRASDMLYVGDALFADGNDSSVKETLVDTCQVLGPHETLLLINDILENH